MCQATKVTKPTSRMQFEFEDSDDTLLAGCLSRASESRGGNRDEEIHRVRRLALALPRWGSGE